MKLIVDIPTDVIKSSLNSYDKSEEIALGRFETHKEYYINWPKLKTYESPLIGLLPWQDRKFTYSTDEKSLSKLTKTQLIELLLSKVIKNSIKEEEVQVYSMLEEVK